MASSINPKAILANMAYVKNIVRRIRNKDGGIGSDADELVLSRLILDVDLLIEVIEALGANNQKLMQMLRGGQSESESSGEKGNGRDEDIQLDQTPA